jgi:hypothetical protein
MDVEPKAPTSDLTEQLRFFLDQLTLIEKNRTIAVPTG